MTQGLSANELASMRAAVAGLLPDTCHILTVTHTSDGAGGWTDTAGTATANVPCRLDIPKPGTEVIAGLSLTTYRPATVAMAYDVTVTTENQLQIGSTIYNITAVNIGQSWAVEKICTVEKVP